MEKTHITIIGAGVIGLAIAEKLSRTHDDILLLEKSDRFGNGASSRNSEVIHAGFYYPETSLKARFCLQGNHMLYEIAEAKSISFRKTGKLVIANTEEEAEKIHSLHEQGVKNGVSGLSPVSARQIATIEPAIRAKEGLYSADTGIIDSHQLMSFFERKAKSRDVMVVYNCDVTGIHKDNDFIVSVRDSSGDEMDIMSEIVINAAGLESDKLAGSAGIDLDAENLRQSFCKGVYFGISARHNSMIKHLVYPVPTPISLGTHTVLKLDGSIKLGPSAFYVDEIDYNVDDSQREEFFVQGSTFLPFLTREDLSPDMAGIRAKLQVKNGPFRDFEIREESDKGLDGLINLIGIESPGLTSAPAIADYVETLL